MFLKHSARHFLKPRCDCSGPSSASLAGKAILNRSKAARVWKPAGQPAEFRSAAAMSALRGLVDDNFQNAGAVWTGCLLQEGLLFRHKECNEYYVSLGFEAHSLILWRVVPHGAPGQQLLHEVLILVCVFARACF